MKLRPGIPAGVAEVYPEDEDDELTSFRHVVPPKGLAGLVDLPVYRSTEIEQAVVLLHEVECDRGICGHVTQHLLGHVKGDINKVEMQSFIGFFRFGGAV